jgi:hypothetical protein
MGWDVGCCCEKRRVKRDGREGKGREVNGWESGRYALCWLSETSP